MPAAVATAVAPVARGPSPTRPPPRHVPALDGLRGLAVVAVLVFHAGFPWASGGYLGVSTFFTLSGFLITSLILRERKDQGTVGLRRFYLRRVRRLWPASFLALLLVALIASVAAGPSEVVDLRAEMVAALAQVTNWFFIIQGRSYADLFEAPSLVQHFWSLAIEEQFYLLLPPLLALAVARRWDLVKIAAATVVAMAASVSVGLALAWRGSSIDRLYYGTDTRAFELLVGVLLAVGLAHRPTALDSPRVASVVRIGGIVAFMASVAAWATVELTSRWLYTGGLWLYACGSALIVASCLRPGPITIILSHPVLRRLGELSYAIYLFHWPIFLWLSPQRLGTSRVIAFLLGCAVTWALALLSADLVEVPIRSGSWGRYWSRRHRPRLAPLSAGAALLAVLVAIPVLVPTGGSPFDLDLSQSELDQMAADIRARDGAPVVGFFGDSTALATSIGLADWATATGRIDFGTGLTELGCGIVTAGDVRYGTGEGSLDRCQPRDALYAKAAGELDLAFVQFGPWDVADHRLPGDDEWRTIGDPVYDAALKAEALRLIDLLSAQGAVVMWVQPPLVRLGTVDGRPPAEDFDASDPARMELFRDLGEELQEARPDSVVLLDLAAWMADQPGGELSGELRPDGVHFPNDVADRVAEEWLGPEIERIWARVSSQS